MYSRILVPVDLAHSKQLDKAITTAAKLSKVFEAPVTLAGVTTSAPSEVAANPEEFGAKLAAFAAQCAEHNGVTMQAQTVMCNDVAADLDKALRAEIDSNGYDLVVMASHVPSFRDILTGSRAGSLASHAGTSVFVVRG